MIILMFLLNAALLPNTIAYVRIIESSLLKGKIVGEVTANQYQWHFQWYFRRGQLLVQPTLGRALIYEPLGRFLEQHDYQLEAGSDYEFLIRAKF